MKQILRSLIAVIFFIGAFLINTSAQQDTAVKQEHFYKNVIRYNLSGGLFFGFDKYVVLGYERVLNRKQSISMNIGRASLPKLVSIVTDSLSLQRDISNNGFNVSLDYRFYLSKENKYLPPHGLYIGPYFSHNNYDRKNEFSFKRPSGNTQLTTTEMKFDINTIGFELGYQFVLWKRLALDLVMIGPGVSNYHLKATLDNNLSENDRQQLREALEQLISQKFPGMNYVFSDHKFDANGLVDTWNFGFRYIIHIGFVF